ncbi:uncharacterized protein LOC134764884 [Penaeus indicus]|uniref:uncharacterized protein LOC134764884 n=1 Tax=Penaeus indicus TaxID=29960 RepID=UPI00300D855B
MYKKTKSNKPPPPTWSFGVPSSHRANHAHQDFKLDHKDHYSAEVKAQNAHRKAREVYHTRLHAVHAHSESPPISNPRVAGLCRELGILEPQVGVFGGPWESFSLAGVSNSSSSEEM